MLDKIIFYTMAACLSIGFSGVALLFPQAVMAVSPAVEALLRTGDSLRARGSIPEAYEYYKRAVALDPSCAMAHRSLGGNLVAQKKYDEGLVEINKAISLHPNEAKLFVDRAVCYAGMNKTALAEADFKKAIADPACGTACYHYLEGIYKKEGKFDDAIALCDLQLKREPKYFHAFEHKAEYLVAKRTMPERGSSWTNASASRPLIFTITNCAAMLICFPNSRGSDCRLYQGPVPGTVFPRANLCKPRPGSRSAW